MTRSFALALILAVSAPAESYFFGFLKSAPNRKTLPKEEAEKIQAAHLAHLGAMNERGGLVCAGPLAGGGALRGVIIYKTVTLAEAQANADADPAVKAGQLVAELFPWTGPAAIGEDFRQRFLASGGKMQMKMVKYHLLLARPGFTTTGAIASGPYRHADATGEIFVFPERTPEDRKALEGDHVRVLLDWYVADGVLPKP